MPRITHGTTKTIIKFHQASMRPRLNAADYKQKKARPSVHAEAASMRPRLNASGCQPN